MRNYLMALTALAFLAVPNSGFGAEEDKWNKFVERRMEKMAAKLELNDEQKKKVKEIGEKAKPELKAKREQKREAFKAFAELLKSESNDQEKIRDAYKRLQAAKAETASAHFEMMLSIRNLLTAEQRKKFQGFMQERRGRRGKHKGGEAESDS